MRKALDLSKMTVEEQVAAVDALVEGVLEIKKAALMLGVQANELRLPATAHTLAHTVSDGCQQAVNFASEVRDRLMSRPKKGE